MTNKELLKIFDNLKPGQSVSLCKKCIMKILCLLFCLLFCCVKTTEPPIRFLVTIDHHTKESKFQSKYGPAMLFIGEKTLVTIPAGMQLTMEVVENTELLANWITFYDLYYTVYVEHLTAIKDTIWRLE